MVPKEAWIPHSASRSLYRIDRYCPGSTGRRNEVSVQILSHKSP